VKSVLIIADDQTVRIAISQMLRFRGYTTVDAEHGCPALEALGGQAIALVIVDVDARGGDRTETIRRIRELRPAVPIIAISAVSSPGWQSPIGDAGLAAADWLVEKPISLKRLLRAADELTGER
jgi:CheY-like chemotaxis protein